MSDEDALLAAIHADPDDDTPRLVYADWLDEHGQPERAEFIRVECQAALTDRDSPTYPQLLRRSGRLSAKNAAHWFGPLALEDIVITRRGFVDGIALSANRFADRTDAILTYAPLLREVHVNAGGDWRAFFASPLLPSIHGLSFADGVFTLIAAEEMAASDGVTALVELNLDRQPLGYAAMAAVASAPLWGLEKLSASEGGIGDDGAEELFASEAFANLRELNLSENGLTDTACRALAAATNFGRLEQLALCDNHITADGVAALAGAPHLGRLRNLNLYLNPIGPDGGRAILASRHWAGLAELNVIACGVGIAVVEDLRWVYGGGVVKV